MREVQARSCVARQSGIGVLVLLGATYERDEDHIVIPAQAAHESAARVPSQRRYARRQDYACYSRPERLPSDIFGSEISFHWSSCGGKVIIDILLEHSARAFSRSVARQVETAVTMTRTDTPPDQLAQLWMGIVDRSSSASESQASNLKVMPIILSPSESKIEQ